MRRSTEDAEGWFIQHCWKRGRLSKKVWYPLISLNIAFSAVLLAVGAAADPLDIPPEIAQLNASLYLHGNYTIQCGSNENTQNYCCGISFSIICGAYGILLGGALVYQLYHRSADPFFLGLVIFLVSALVISLGVWAEVVASAVTFFPLNVANLSFSVVSFLFWSMVGMLLIYSPLETFASNRESS